MKKIVVTQEDAEKIVRETVGKITSVIGLAPESEKIDINPSVKLEDKDKVELVFSETARKKMYYLIEECDQEIGWHGLVERTEKGFYVEDIIVFPQKVTGATVITDDDKYPTWMDTQPNDIFNKICFHGHSHVNMTTYPSSVDSDYQDYILKQRMSGPRKEDEFYIFGIFNKKGDYWLNIYDIDANKLYENDDIDYYNYEPSEQDWAREQIKENVVTKTYDFSKYRSSKAKEYGSEALYDTWKENYDKEQKETKELDNAMLDKVLADIAPPTYGSRWSKYLQRMIGWDEDLNDLIKEYCITYPDYSPREKGE